MAAHHSTWRSGTGRSAGMPDGHTGRLAPGGHRAPAQQARHSGAPSARSPRRSPGSATSRMRVVAARTRSITLPHRRGLRTRATVRARPTKASRATNQIPPASPALRAPPVRSGVASRPSGQIVRRSPGGGMTVAVLARVGDDEQTHDRRAASHPRRARRSAGSSRILRENDELPCPGRHRSRLDLGDGQRSVDRSPAQDVDRATLAVLAERVFDADAPSRPRRIDADVCSTIAACAWSSS